MEYKKKNHRFWGKKGETKVLQTYTAVKQRQHQEKWCTLLIQEKYTKTTSQWRKEGSYIRKKVFEETEYNKYEQPVENALHS